MLIRAASLAASGGAARADVRLRGDRIESVAARLEALAGEPVLDAGGGELLPGLHDHHIHLFSLAASLRSVRCGPPQVRDARQLARALARAPGSGGDWIRGVGYHESVAGELDAASLAALAPERPVRIQHRSGAAWIVNRAGLARLGLAGVVPTDAPAGVERDARGHATGRLYRTDVWLRQRLGRSAPPALGPVGTALARVGVTGVTDATPDNGARELASFERARASGALPQQLHLMGAAALPAPPSAGVWRAHEKILLDEARLVDPDALTERIRAAHARDRRVAIHCVTRTELVVALAAFAAAGPVPGDRIEHASIAPPELAHRIASLGLCVVTQPNFVRERGDAYRRDVEARDRRWLYRCRGLLEAGVLLGAGTDAPFGDPDPWRAMQAAVERRTGQGALLAAEEALSPERALALFTTAADDPGGAPRAVRPGAPASLVLLDRPWARMRDHLDADAVTATWCTGRLAWQRETDGRAPVPPERGCPAKPETGP